MNSQWPLGPFPKPPRLYDRTYFNSLIRSIEDTLRRARSPGVLESTSLVLYGATAQSTYSTRALLVTDVANGLVDTDGKVVVAAGLAYKWQAGATAISDLPGLIPADHIIDVQCFGTTRAAIVAAVDYAASSDRPVKFTPLTSGSYYEGDTGNISIPANVKVLGSYDGPIRVNSTTLNPLFLVAGADVVIDGIKCVGNQADQRSTSSGSVAISATSVARPTIKNCYITDFTRHGILVDGCSDPEIINNRIENIYIGCGILAGSTIACTGFTRIVGNRVKNTQQGNIQGYLGPDNLLVADNVCDTTNWGSGDLADNITFYTATDGSNYIITGNHCKGSGNHGIHVGADEMIVTNNNVVSCQAHGIFAARSPNADPAIMTGVTISGNVIKNCNLAALSYCGVAVRNADGVAVANNIIDGAGYGIELYGLGTVLNVTNGYVTGNVGRNITTAGIYRRGTLSNDLVVENNPGLTDPNKPKKTNRVLSGTFAIGSTGKKSVIIPHGLHTTPTSKDVQFTVVEESNVDDFVISHIKFATADATNVVAEVIVGTASAGAGNLARLAMWVDITTKYS